MPKAERPSQAWLDSRVQFSERMALDYTIEYQAIKELAVWRAEFRILRGLPPEAPIDPVETVEWIVQQAMERKA